MISRRIRAALLVISASLGLAACTTYDGYGYGGYYGGRYSYYDSWPTYGWYDDFYYPGRGYYIYDRSGHRHAWNREQRRHWLSRSRDREDRRQIRQNFRTYRADRLNDRSGYRAERRANREALRSGQLGRRAFRAEQRSDRRAFRQERRSDRSALIRSNRRAIRD